MIATTHMLAGAAAACRAPSPLVALTAGVASHLLVDAIPHTDYRPDALGGLVLGADLAVGTVAVCRLAGRSEVLLAGALGGALPDVLVRAKRLPGVSLVRRLHNMAHSDARPAAWRSALFQGLLALGGALALRASAEVARRSPQPSFQA